MADADRLGHRVQVRSNRRTDVWPTPTPELRDYVNDDSNEETGLFGRPCRPRSNEHLWRECRDHRFVDAELVYHAEHGVEVQFLFDSTTAYTRRWPTRALAIEEATAQRRELERVGWHQPW